MEHELDGVLRVATREEVGNLISHRRDVERQLKGQPFWQLEMYLESARDEADKADIAWVIERRKLQIKQYAQQLSLKAELFDGAALTVAGAVVYVGHLVPKYFSASQSDPITLVSATLAGVVWGVLKVSAYFMRSKAKRMLVAIGGDKA
jgi:hypothetical protein